MHHCARSNPAVVENPWHTFLARSIDIKSMLQAPVDHIYLSFSCGDVQSILAILQANSHGHAEHQHGRWSICESYLIDAVYEGWMPLRIKCSQIAGEDALQERGQISRHCLVQRN
jgi:hypothetical protein